MPAPTTAQQPPSQPGPLLPLLLVIAGASSWNPRSTQSSDKTDSSVQSLLCASSRKEQRTVDWSRLAIDRSRCSEVIAAALAITVAAALLTKLVAADRVVNRCTSAVSWLGRARWTGTF